ncbi:membrane-bound lytic murein transglycosylase MltF [Thalassotalea maritima]|uniref:membrane-bound lytic murein transglycosylase MltF n=1 Tax=Thalassotalea maritima TaxID=3242416 RepID=UPI0035293EC0
MDTINTKRNIRNALIFSFLLLSALLLGSCEREQTDAGLAAIIERGELRVGTLYGPHNYIAGADRSTGFEYELAKAYADYLGVKLTVVPTYSLIELFNLLETEQADFLAAGLSVTEERLKKYRFSPSYAKVSQKLVFKQGKTWPRKLENLKGDLRVVRYSSHDENLTKLKETHPNLTWDATDEYDADELLQQVLDEEIDFTVADSNALALNRRMYPELAVALTLQEEKPIAWMLNKNADDTLLASLIEFFGEAIHDGTVYKIEDKYYGHVREFDYVDNRAFIRAIESKLPKYEAMFKRYSGELDWRFIAAVAYQESHWEPLARSYTGVRGMMMLTMPTAKEMGVTVRTDPEQSIRGGSKYLASLIERIPERIQEPDRIWFALASYNVGLGHVNDARKLTEQQGGDPDRWLDVKQRLPLLKQRKYYKQTKYGYARGDEASKYVENIRAYYDTLVFMENQKNSRPEGEEKNNLIPQPKGSEETEEAEEAVPAN